MTQNEIDVVNKIENGLYSEFNWLFRDNSKYVAMIKIVENAIDKYSKEIRKQVCDEIKIALTSTEPNCSIEDLDSDLYEFSGREIYAILDQIEQAKESIK